MMQPHWMMMNLRWNNLWIQVFANLKQSKLNFRIKLHPNMLLSYLRQTGCLDLPQVLSPKIQKLYMRLTLILMPKYHRHQYLSLKIILTFRLGALLFRATLSRLLKSKKFIKCRINSEKDPMLQSFQPLLFSINSYLFLAIIAIL